MSLGSTIRQAFGPAEPAVARLYRRAFFNPAGLCKVMGSMVEPRDVLEVGCGEGLLTQELAEAFPHARFFGIDVDPRAGRLFRGDALRVSFGCEPVAAYAASHPGAHDVVVISDVLHHVRPAERSSFLSDAGRALAPGGLVVVKEWVRSPTVPHLLGWLSDRFITQDAVEYSSLTELRALLRQALPGARFEGEVRLRPWRNNVALFLTPRPVASPSGGG